MNAYLRVTQDKDMPKRLFNWLARASRTLNPLYFGQSPLKRAGQFLINVFDVFYELNLVSVANFMVMSGTFSFEVDLTSNHMGSLGPIRDVNALSSEPRVKLHHFRRAWGRRT